MKRDTAPASSPHATFASAEEFARQIAQNKGVAEVYYVDPTARERKHWKRVRTYTPTAEEN